MINHAANASSEVSVSPARRANLALTLTLSQALKRLLPSPVSRPRSLSVVPNAMLAVPSATKPVRLKLNATRVNQENPAVASLLKRRRGYSHPF
jgi:hypothetical protein